MIYKCTALLHSVHTMDIKVTHESSDQFYIDSIVYCRMLAKFVPVISTNNVCSYIYIHCIIYFVR